MSPPRIWITGAGGLIGHQIVRFGPGLAPEWTLVPLLRGDLDLLDFPAVRRRFESDRPSLILHCAGLTRSPLCESQPEQAHRLNVDMTGHLVEVAGDSETVLVFLSSDMVFDGARGAYKESDTPHPLNVYGRTKLAAEGHVLRHPRHLVVRTSLNYGASPTGDRAFNEEMVAAARRGETIRLFIDEFRCPIAAEVTARAVWEISRAALRGDRLKRPSGVLHVAGSERLSRWAIGEALATVHPELRGRLAPVSRSEYRGAPRPADTSMDCSKAQAWLSFPLPGFSQWLQDHQPGTTARS